MTDYETHPANSPIPPVTPTTNTADTLWTQKESISVLAECAELQTKKSNDYQNAESRIVQADYYPRGVATILDIIHAKKLRAQSVIEAMEKDPSYEPNFESLEDSFRDMINYATFAVSWIRGKMEGQEEGADFLNRKQ